MPNARLPPLWLVANESQLVVMHSAGWHVVTLSTLAYAAVADSPTTAQGDYLGGRMYYPLEDGTYGWTELNSASALDSLSFASAETLPDPVIAVAEDLGEMVILGETTTEFSQESGDPEFLHEDRCADLETEIYETLHGCGVHSDQECGGG